MQVTNHRLVPAVQALQLACHGTFRRCGENSLQHTLSLSRACGSRIGASCPNLQRSGPFARPGGSAENNGGGIMSAVFVCWSGGDSLVSFKAGQYCWFAGARAVRATRSALCSFRFCCLDRICIVLCVQFISISTTATSQRSRQRPRGKLKSSFKCLLIVRSFSHDRGQVTLPKRMFS